MEAPFMKDFNLLLQHSKNNQLKNRSILRLTFSEAVTEAYKIKSILGHEWEINQIKRVK